MVDFYERNEILDRISDAFFAVNTDWEFTYINAEASKILFGNADQLVGNWMWSEIPTAVYITLYAQFHKAMLEQVSVEFDVYYSPLATWFGVKAYPSSSGLSIFFQDITQKKGISLEKEQHYESLFKYNPDAVFAFNLEGNYLQVNPAMERMIGYRADELLKMSYLPLIPPEELEKTRSYFYHAAKGITQHYETKAIHKNGGIIDVKVTNIPIIVNDEVKGVFGVAKEITQENNHKMMLLQAEKLTAVGQLAASIAHEIRNPLTSLKGFTQLIEKTLPDAKKNYFTIMKDEINRIDLITSELLYLAKPKAQGFKSEHIWQIIQDVVMLMSSQALMNNIEIRTFHLEELPVVECVGAQLKQVFINLIKNAMEAMPDGGHIDIVGSRPTAEVIKVQVMDNGQGIPRELISKIGSPFYSTKENGTGLGMMATQQIIHSHKGTLEITSQEGLGTTIHICLPIDEQA
ncbi:PAS domain-containing sensor histidine kinase [Paenibacillus sp. Soil766]|uniref:PAS domain-containing sensor histidine kinase n=1 Tax=Paenibacillus sp. Soil766 TaxID=1736404 RepID=UPI00070C92D7|nr:PAS domain-containing sensor histidine kinase [Paenibacillus sp. Soil766]KRF02275.1 PAS domain-containing sensor histidine kinase [Paenibacillus sp. Soil766]